MTKQPLTFKMITKNADMLTPVGIFKRLIGEKKFLLETSHYEMNVLAYYKMLFPKQSNELPLPFTCGTIGYTAYEAIRAYKDIGDELPDDIKTPDHHFMLYQAIIAYEHRTETAYIITNN